MIKFGSIYFDERIFVAFIDPKTKTSAFHKRRFLQSYAHGDWQFEAWPFVNQICHDFETQKYYSNVKDKLYIAGRIGDKIYSIWGPDLNSKAYLKL